MTEGENKKGPPQEKPEPKNTEDVFGGLLDEIEKEEAGAKIKEPTPANEKTPPLPALHKKFLQKEEEERKLTDAEKDAKTLGPGREKLAFYRSLKLEPDPQEGSVLRRIADAIEEKEKEIEGIEEVGPPIRILTSHPEDLTLPPRDKQETDEEYAERVDMVREARQAAQVRIGLERIRLQEEKRLKNKEDKK